MQQFRMHVPEDFLHFVFKFVHLLSADERTLASSVRSVPRQVCYPRRVKEGGQISARTRKISFLTLHYLRTDVSQQLGTKITTLMIISSA